MTAAVAVCMPAAPSVDCGKRFIPEKFTPLFYSHSYHKLTDEQKLRYNQLHALYFNEQIIFFEVTMGQAVLEALLREPWPPHVTSRLRQLKEEERQHSEMFRRLNRLCAPHLYATRDFHFVQVPRVLMLLGNWATSHPLLFPMFLWLMLLQEERSLYYSCGFIREQGSIEPHFVKTQRLHLADESGHVHLDEELIEILWGRASKFLR